MKLGKLQKVKQDCAVSDVEQTHHVTLTVHKFIQDGGQCRRSVSVGIRF